MLTAKFVAPVAKSRIDALLISTNPTEQKEICPALRKVCEVLPPDDAVSFSRCVSRSKKEGRVPTGLALFGIIVLALECQSLPAEQALVYLIPATEILSSALEESLNEYRRQKASRVD